LDTIIILNGIENSCFLYDAVLNINEKFTESSIFAFSSRFEGFGMVITEAMSCGIPPVAFACPCGPKDIISDGVDGILVTPENVDELSDKICFLIENEDIRREMGRRARIRAEQFRIEVIAKEWNTLFENLLTPDN
jgi:glycosyltransferase involved in cell wall biosynthesis